MLEVGTGFNPELTGRDNIYLNGAILGMNRAEVTKKLDQIIAFSECEQFIDTPVKRYSSGMYVKLAFAVAAHLDSEILVMDEVLAVGDMKFQQKCLGKMSDVSAAEGRTVLYVSHNMNTIRQLCDRCIVLSHGKKIFDGDVEKAIALYADIKKGEIDPHFDLRKAKRFSSVTLGRKASFVEGEILGKEKNVFEKDEVFHLRLTIDSEITIEKAKIRVVVFDMYDRKIASAVCMDAGKLCPGRNQTELELSFNGLIPGDYRGEIVLFETNEFGTIKEHDVIPETFHFEVTAEKEDSVWNALNWGAFRMNNMKAVTPIHTETV